MKSGLKILALNILPERVLLTLKRVHYTHTLKNLSSDAENEFKIIKHLVTPGASVVDIGSNIGIYTKYLSEAVGRNGSVYSFEPVPETYDFLVSITKKLALSNVKTFNLALSDTDGSLKMQIPKYSYGGENFYQAMVISDQPDYFDKSCRRIDVDCRTLDSLLYDPVRKIEFIKCDVELHELRCIKGASKIIDKHRPSWLIEINGDPNNPDAHPYKTMELMKKYGYGIYWLDGDILRRLRPGIIQRDYFFLPPDTVDSLQAKGIDIK